MKVSSILLMLFVVSCSDKLDRKINQIKTNFQIESSEKIIDSTIFYNFFKGKETLSFADKNIKDSVVLTYNKFGLPDIAIEYYLPNDILGGDQFGKRVYHYNMNDSTETIYHYTPYDALKLKEVRQFDSLGRIIYFKTDIMNSEVMEFWYRYDGKGRQIQIMQDKD